MRQNIGARKYLRSQYSELWGSCPPQHGETYYFIAKGKTVNSKQGHTLFNLNIYCCRKLRSRNRMQYQDHHSKFQFAAGEFLEDSNINKSRLFEAKCIFCISTG